MDQATVLTSVEFRSLMQTIADGWNEGNARKSANCFAEDAIYTEPPNKQFYRGRESLYEFFGGGEEPAPSMSMTWHHLLFDEQEQIGVGEYTYQGMNRYHGLVIVKVTSGRVSNWREYQYKSDLKWDEFIGANKF
jgi:hypothetical protein